MASELSPFVEANYGWPYGSAGWNTEMDANLVKFSYLHDRNIDAIVASLPAIADGTAYFNTADNRLYFDAEGVRYSSPTPKWFEVTLRTTGEVYQFDGGALTLKMNLSELATAINNDPAYHTTVDTALGTKVDTTDFDDAVDIIDASIATKVSTVDLADPTDPSKGAALVGYQSGTVATALASKVNSTDLANATDPLKGAGVVGVLAPDGTGSTVGAELEAIDKEYDRSAWSVLAGALQTGPLIVDASRYLRITGDLADAAYNNAAYQNILAGLPFGAEIEHPARGMAYLNGNLDITAAGTHLRGHNSAGSYDQFVMQFMNAAVPMFNVKHSGLAMERLILQGAITGRALNDTQDALNFDVTLNDGHADARIDSVGFIYVRAGASVINFRARNIRFNNCVFSNSQRAFSMERVPVGSEDQRVFEFHNCKYHSMGRLLSSVDSVFYVNPLSQALELIVTGGHADDTVRIMRGFAGQSEITALASNRAAGAFADLDSTGFTLDGYRTFDIDACKLKNINTTTHQFSAIKAVGAMALTVADFVVSGAGGHGIEIHSNDVDIRSTIVHNASCGATGVYSGFYVASGATDTIFGGGCAYKHNREVTSGSIVAKYGVENLGTNTMFLDRLAVIGMAAGTNYYIDPLVTSRGPDPVQPGALQRISWGGNTAPTTGKYSLGDVQMNIGSSGTGLGLRCSAAGTPGTWTA